MPAMWSLLRNLELKIASLGFVLTLAMVTANVVLRYVAGRSLLFSEEISYLGFAYTVFLGAAYLYRRRVMIAVYFVVTHLSPRAQHWTSIGTLLLLLVANLALLYISLLLVQDGWVRRTAYLNLPYAFIHSAGAISFLLMAIYSAVFLVQGLRGRDVHYADAADQI